MMRNRLLSSLLCLGILLTMLPVHSSAAEPKYYSDVTESDWFSDSVQYVYNHGLMKGTSETTFSPYRDTQRGMIVTILYRLDGSPEVSTALSFNDVAAESNYAKAIAWASSHSIVTGYNNSTFGPYDTITRQQMAAILYRYAQMKGYQTSAMSNLEGYTDAEQISSYARTAMSWANANGLINGNSSNELLPGGSATRAQTAAILMRFCENIVNSANPESAEPTGIDESDGSAGSTVSEGESTHTVIFNLNDSQSSVYQTLTVKDGDRIAAPQTPSRDGYNFLGWFTKAEAGSRFDFNTIITSSLTLFASWGVKSSSSSSSHSSSRSSTVYYTITFDSNGGSSIPSQTIRSGGTASPPNPVPTREGFSFGGWYSNDQFEGSTFNFNTPILSNLTLTARWNQGADNLDDDEIDLGDIQVMLSNNEIEVIFGENGKIRTIIGDFAHRKVENSSDAVDVLNSAKQLFGSSFNAEDDNITTYSVGDGASQESFYRLNPVVNDVPVIGSQIILSTDNEGTVSGLFSSYNSDISNVSTDPSISSDEAVNAAIDEWLQDEDVQDYIDSLVTDNMDRDEVENLIRERLDVESELVIYAADETERPALTYAVTLSSIDEGDDDAELQTFSNRLGTVIDNVLADRFNFAHNNDATNSEDSGTFSDGHIVVSLSAMDINGDIVNGDNQPAEEEPRPASDGTSIPASDGTVIPAADGGTESITPEGADFADEEISAEDSSERASEADPEVEKSDSAEDQESADSNGPFQTASNSIPLCNVTFFIYARSDYARSVLTWMNHIVSAYGMNGWILHANNMGGHAALGETTTTDESRRIRVNYSDEAYRESGLQALDNFKYAYDFYKGFGWSWHDYYRQQYLLVDVGVSPESVGYALWTWEKNKPRFAYSNSGGRRMTAPLDIAGHIYTASVLDNMDDHGFGLWRGLKKTGESGALRIAFGDIMGSLIEAIKNSYSDDNNNKWLIGEDGGTAIGDMASPNPYRNGDSDNRNGGNTIYTKSVWFSNAAYRMMTDSRTSEVTDQRWAEMFYRSMYRLTQNANFLDARGAVIASANELGFTSDQQQAIKDAFDAVGIVEPNTIRIVLRWGAEPRDLDSHLVGPGVSGDRFHTWFSDKIYYYQDYRYAVDLDYDDTTSYGPEITTIHVFTPGVYYFYVHDFTNGGSTGSDALMNSGAYIEVYKGSGNQAEEIYRVEEVEGNRTGKYWNVFSLTIRVDGSMEISRINTITENVDYT